MRNKHPRVAYCIRLWIKF